jgi:tetratricopeptide (TPR) repeat protein
MVNGRGFESNARMTPTEPNGKTPTPEEKAVPPAGPESTTPPSSDASPEDNERQFRIDLGDGFDEAIKNLRERAEHYYKKSQHTQVRIKFRGKEVVTVALPVLLAVEAATFWWTGPLRLLLMNAMGKTFLDVEFINEADHVVAAGKERLLDGELDEALEKFREAITMDRDHPGAHLNLGVALKLKGQKDEAMAAFEKATALDPSGETGKEARRQIEKFKK